MGIVEVLRNYFLSRTKIMYEGLIAKRRYAQFHGNGMFHGRWCKDCDLDRLPVLRDLRSCQAGDKGYYQRPNATDIHTFKHSYPYFAI